MEITPNDGSPPFDPTLTKTKTPEQGGVSKTYILKDEKTGESFVHKVMDNEHTGRYGDDMPILEKAQRLQRIHGVLSEIFEGKVAPTQFIIAKSEGVNQIEIVQPFVEGPMVYDLPLTDRQELSDYIKEKSAGGTANLESVISSKSNIPMDIAEKVVAEIKFPGNWMKNPKTGDITLVDF